MPAPPDDERRVTEDLLAGFDRPGRSPRAPAVRNAIDFNGGSAAVGPAAETVLVTRRQSAGLWPWLAVAFLVSAGVGIVGFALVTRGAGPVQGAEAAIAREKHTVTTPIEPVVPASVVTLAPATSTAPRTTAAPSARKPEPHRDDFAHEL